jgi:Ulp1 family protease
MIIQCWTEQFGRFQRQDPPSVQIHHRGKSHWVTSLQDKKDGTVYVLDSYSNTFTLTPSLEIQLSAIYGQGKTNLLIKPEVQQQTNGYNCGVYALANLVEFCYNGTYNTHITLRGI